MTQAFFDSLIDNKKYRIIGERLQFLNFKNEWEFIKLDYRGMFRIKNQNKVMEWIKISDFITGYQEPIKTIASSLPKDLLEKSNTPEQKEFKKKVDKALKKELKEIKVNVRSEQLPKLRKLIEQGKSNNAISKELMMPRPTVIYYKRQIEQGKPLRFEADKLPPKTK